MITTSEVSKKPGAVQRLCCVLERGRAAGPRGRDRPRDRRHADDQPVAENHIRNWRVRSPVVRQGAGRESARRSARHPPNPDSAALRGRSSPVRATGRSASNPPPTPAALPAPPGSRRPGRRRGPLRRRPPSRSCPGSARPAPWPRHSGLSSRPAEWPVSPAT